MSFPVTALPLGGRIHLHLDEHLVAQSNRYGSSHSVFSGMPCCLPVGSWARVASQVRFLLCLASPVISLVCLLSYQGFVPTDIKSSHRVFRHVFFVCTCGSGHACSLFGGGRCGEGCVFFVRGLPTWVSFHVRRCIIFQQVCLFPFFISGIVSETHSVVTIQRSKQKQTTSFS